MQEHALQAKRLESAIAFPIAVFLVASNGMSRVRRVNSDLMCAPGAEIHIQKRGEFGEMLHGFEGGCRFLTVGVDSHNSFAALLEIRF